MENLSITVKNPYTSKKISTELQEGILTVLVGRNGYGKTSFIKGIKEYAENNENCHCISWNDMEYGRDRGRETLILNGRVEELASMSFSSEGETLINSIINFFIKKAGYYAQHKVKKGEKIFLLIDQLDSGLDIHQINEIKDIIKNTIIKDMHNRGVQVFAIASANSYELAENEICMNPRTGKIVKITDLESYRKYIDKQYKNR